MDEKISNTDDKIRGKKNAAVKLKKMLNMKNSMNPQRNIKVNQEKEYQSRW